MSSTKEADIKKGLDLSLQLYKLLPNDYYVENRIFTAYIFYAKQEIEKKNWRVAEEWTLKGLKIRFHTEAMRTRLQILIGEAGDFIVQKKYAEAKKNLSEVVSIAGIAENKVLYPNEKKKAEAFLSKIPQ